MLSRRPDHGRRFRWTRRPERRLPAAAALLLIAAALGSLTAAPAAVRRAALADTQLAAEVDGILYLEILAAAGDSAASLAAAFGGTKSAASVLRAANGGAEPVPGAFYRLPFEVLLNDHRRRVLAALYPEEIAPPDLEFGSDAEGPYAAYRLKPGEALYSAVVVRFTGRVEPAEVNALAEVVARRSGIANVRRIPAGSAVKIPLDLVAPEFLPPGSPQRDDAESAVAASARYRLSAGAVRLEGVHLVLDAGHGGDDSGALKFGVSEHEYAYDVMCRVRDLLLRKTAAHVVTTIRDRTTGYRLLDGRIRRNRAEYLLTDPPYNLRSRGATTVGVNARWRLANQELQRLTSQGVPPERIVFISFHADSLHPSLRGTMVYVPARGHRRALPRGVSAVDLERAEGLSRALAREVVASLRSTRLGVHAFMPIRDHVIRSGRSWIPAVLRASRVPHSMLIEVANLNNREDRALIVRTEFRQRVAEAVVEALVRYYASARPGAPVEARRIPVAGAP